MKGIEIKIEDRPMMTGNYGSTGFEAPSFPVWAHKHRTPSTLKRDTEKLGVAFDVILLASRRAELQVGVAPVRLAGLHVNMAKLGSTHKVAHL
jgi:hypothetical protein